MGLNIKVLVLEILILMNTFWSTQYSYLTTFFEVPLVLVLVLKYFESPHKNEYIFRTKNYIKTNFIK